MAATNYTPIQLYYSTTASAAPAAGNLVSGELAINITDGKLYYKDNGGNVQVIATKGAGTIGGSNTQIQFNDGGALAGNAAMVFNKATNVTTLTTLNLTNALGATYGGTAQSAYAQGDLLYASAVNTLSKLSIGTVNYILTSTGSVPQWVAPTSVTVQTANNLAGGAAGSVPYQSAADTTTFLAIGAANRVMTSTGSAPQWVTSLTGLTGVSSSSMTNTSLTSGRVVYSGASGVQTDSANLTFNGTTLSAGGFSTTGNSTLVKLVTIGDSSFTTGAVLAAATPAKLYIGTGAVTDGTSAGGATNTLGTITAFGQTQVIATNANVTYTNLATLYVAGAPTAGTNVTITNPYSLYIAGGASYFGGALTLATALSTANGGTGLSSFTAGDLVYYASGTAFTKLGIGTNGQILTSTGTAPQWSTLSGVAVTTFSAGTTGFTPSSATSGAITLAGTLATTNGGTGLTSFTANGLVYATSTSALTTGSALTYVGENLTVTAGSTGGTTGFTASNTAALGYTALTLKNTGASGKTYEVGVGGNGTAGLYQNNLYIRDTSGNPTVAINSTGLGVFVSPSYALDVKASGAFNVARFAGQVSSVSTYIYTDTAYWAFGDGTSYTGQLYGGHAINKTLSMYTNSVERVQIGSSGTVTIFSGGLNLGSGGANGYISGGTWYGINSGDWTFQAGNASQKFIWNNSSGTNQMSFDPANLRLGIGAPSVNRTTGLTVWKANESTNFTINNANGTANILDYTAPSAIGVGGRIIFGATYYTYGNTMGTGGIGTYKIYAPSNGSDEYDHLMQFFTSSSSSGIHEAMRLTNNNQLSVNTTNYGSYTQVNTYGGPNVVAYRVFDGNHDNSSSTFIYPISAYYARRDNNIRFTNPITTTAGSVGATAVIAFSDRPGTGTYPYNVRTSDILFYTALNNGNGGIDANPYLTMQIYAEGTIQFNRYGAGTLSTNGSGVISASDGRLKTKTRDLTEGLSKIRELAKTTMYYLWNEGTPMHSEHEEIGWAAQDVAAVIPEASPDPGENRFRNYHDRAVIAYMAKAIDELAAQIESLKTA